MLNLKLGADGLLTDPNDDRRDWLWGHLYRDGSLVVTADPDPDPARELRLSGRVAANARYGSPGAMPWGAASSAVASCEFAGDVACDVVALDYWFHGCYNLAGVGGWGNVGGVTSARYAFANCTSLAALDLAGLDPSGIVDWFYAFSSCRSLETIYVDPTWELAEGASGLGCFYGCSSIVGGNGTTYASGGSGAGNMVIDREGRPGYLTARE